MNDKKKSTARRSLDNIATLFIMLFGLAMILLPFGSLGFFLDGYPKIGAILLGVFLVQIFITVVFFKHDKKKQLAKEAEYRALNIVEYESDAGRLGMLQLEYDKSKDLTTLGKGFPAIFTADESPSLVAFREKLDGRKVERIADRLSADRELIINGVLEEYSKTVRVGSEGGPELSGIKLDEIEIEDSGSTVICYFSFQSTPICSTLAEVSYRINKEGYSFFLEND